MDRWAVTCLGCVAVCAAGCIEAGPYDGLRAYDAQRGEYRVWYLAPPWEIAAEEGSTVQLQVPSSTAGLVPIVRPTTYSLEVHVTSGEANALAQAEQAAALANGDALLAGVRPALTRSGDAGFEVAWQSNTTFRFLRTAYFDDVARNGSVIVFGLESGPMPLEPEVDEMIRVFDVRPGLP